MTTISPQTPKDEITARELMWLVEAAQEREQVSVGTLTRRGLESDLGKARRTVARFIRLGLLSKQEEPETKGHMILLNTVIEQIMEQGHPVPCTAGLTKGEWQLTSMSDRDPQSERIVIARQQSSDIAPMIATVHANIPLHKMPWGAPDAEEREVNGRAITAVPRLIDLVKLFMNHHAICGEDEPGEGCPCGLCEYGRTLLAMIYGREYTPRNTEDDE